MLTRQVILTFWMLTTSGCASSFVKEISPAREAKARLYDDLAAHRALTNKLSPLSQDGVVLVDFNIWITKVKEIVEAKQTLETYLYTGLNWTDEDLAWNEADYGNVTYVKIPSNIVWRPTVHLISDEINNDIEPITNTPLVDLYSDGSLSLHTNRIVTTHCDFDLTYYPFDSHTCSIYLFTEADIRPGMVVLENVPTTLRELPPFSFNGEWAITNRSSSHFFIEDLNMYVIELRLEMSRNSLYYVLCLLLPMTSTSMLTLLVFWIPPASGEKMSYLVSIYVSTALFLGFVGETLPRNICRDNTPRMTLFLLFVIAECVLALVATVFVLRRHQQETKLYSRYYNGPNNGDLAGSPSLGNLRMSGDQGVTQEKEEHTGGSECNLNIFKRLYKRVSGTSVGMDNQKAQLVSARCLDTYFFWIFFVSCIAFYTLVFLV